MTRGPEHRIWLISALEEAASIAGSNSRRLEELLQECDLRVGKP
jgi:hypothetical protein